MKSARIAGTFAIVLAAALPSACNSFPQAVGNVTSIIVIAPDSLWAEVGDSLTRVLEPQIFTVRDERTFELTHISPQDPRWSQLREFRQVLVIGAAEDGWVAPVLERADAAGASAPALIQTRDVWARNQFATAMVAPAQGAAGAVLSQAPRLAAVTDSLFRAYARGRMYTSKADTLLRDSLRASAGYGILLPNVYESVRRRPDLQLFQNSTQIGGDLVRSILVAWREGMHAPTQDATIAWRDSIARTEYRPAQITKRERFQAQQLDNGGRAVLQVQGVWEGTDPNWPLAGPFIARMVQCPAQNRTYLLDSWVYAPGRPRYEYMIQLETILNTFECTG